MTKPKSFSEYLDTEKNDLEKVLDQNNALNKVPNNPDPSLMGGYKRLALIHRIQGNMAKYYTMLQRVENIGLTFANTKEPRFLKEEKFQKDISIKTSQLCNYGYFQFNTSIYLFLAHSDTKKIFQLFEWTVINCTLPDEYLSLKHSTHLMNIAFSYLWKGYALLGLERYNEAYENLIKVAPIYQNVKKAGGEVWHTVEYALTKALVPLCEFKLNPTQENLKKAQKGVEEYIKSLHDNKFKLDGYVYYFHLKEQFADVYSVDAKTYTGPANQAVSFRPKPYSPPVASDAEESPGGSIIINDPEKTQILDAIGSVEDLQKFVEYTKNLTGFPELAALFDLYTLQQCTDAKPIADESRKFITTPGLDPSMQKIARRIYDTAKEAADAGSVVMIYYDPEVSPDLLK